MVKSITHTQSQDVPIKAKTRPSLKKLAPKPISASSRYIKISTKRIVLTLQDNKCANKPESRRVFSYLCNKTGNTIYYNCMLWKYCEGNFDEAGYQYDHIREFSRATKENNVIKDINGVNNIQALCHACHAVKTRAFAQCKQEICGDVIMQGGQRMAIDND